MEKAKRKKKGFYTEFYSYDDNGKPTDDLKEVRDFYREIFYTLREAQVLIEEWRLEYNTFRPHSSLKYRPPAPEAWLH